VTTLLIDSNGIGFQAAYGYQGLDDDQVASGIRYSFMSRLLSLAKRFKTNRFVFFWDSRRNIRKIIFPAYKLKRSEDSEILRLKEQCHPQFKLLRQTILPACGFRNIFMQTGYESDDLIAKVVHSNEALQTPKRMVIVSGDEDLYQLLTPNCSMWIPRKGIMFTYEDFREEYGIVPAQWSSVKAIAGCKSDEIPGIDGVGEKSVLRYLRGELNKSSSYYKKIQCEEGINAELFFRPLVELPMEGTKPCKIVKDELNFKGFIQVCRDYDLYSFRRNKDEWKRYIFDTSKRQGELI
jgi:DNA polymerase-1